MAALLKIALRLSMRILMIFLISCRFYMLISIFWRRSLLSLCSTHRLTARSVFFLGSMSLSAVSQKWQSTANKATRGTQANGQSTYNSAANTALTANTTTAEGWAYICGVFRVSAAGTLIPQVSFSTITGGPIVAVKQNSFFRVKKLNQVYRATRIAPPAAPGPLTPQWS